MSEASPAKWSARAEIARSMALLPVSDSEGRALCAARVASCAEEGQSDAVLHRSRAVTAAVYLSRATLRMGEGRRLLDALAIRATKGEDSIWRTSLREDLIKSFQRDRALQIELACESVSSPARSFMQECLVSGKRDKEKDPVGDCHPDVLIRKLLHADDSGTTLRYTATEVDAVFFQANEVDTEVVHSLWSGPAAPPPKQKEKGQDSQQAVSESAPAAVAIKSGTDELHLADEDYYVSMERHSIASRIADATATDLGVSQRIAVQPGGLRALRHLAESTPSVSGNDLFETDIARCIANVAAGATDIAATATRAVDDGLVSLLSRWADSDLKHAARGHLRAESFRALSNLSQSLVPEDAQRYRYVNGLLPLSAPALDGTTALPRSRIDTDVVFVHGLRGGPLMTWRCGTRIAMDSFGNVTEEPKSNGHNQEEGDAAIDVWARDWLAEDAPNCRVLSIGHDAGVLRGGLGAGMIGPTLSSRAEDIRQALRVANVGADGRKVVLVSHSYGGLLVKELLLKDDELMRQTRGVVFFGVPHFGSPVAGSLGQTKLVLSQAVRELFPAADARAALERLNDDFASAVEASARAGSKIRVVSFGEGKKLKVGARRGQAAVLLDLVPRNSADPQLGQFWLVHDADHVQLSKPTRKEDFRYRVVAGIAMGRP